ncbi:MAG: hypothetical protein ACRYFZ_01720 [Janthinobacterium lividum]
MTVSQKELEDFLWEQPRTCEARGLRVGQSFFALGRRYRHLSLGPYSGGVAQQVSVRFAPERNCYFVQVVLSTTGTVGTRLYLLAKQQLCALRDLLPPTERHAGLRAPFLSCVLVGRRLKTGSNFLYALNQDPCCRAFAYSCDAAGLRFLDASQVWGPVSREQSPELRQIAADLLTERADALAINHAARPARLAGLVAPSPTELAALVITPAGVLANPDTRH